MSSQAAKKNSAGLGSRHCLRSAAPTQYTTTRASKIQPSWRGHSDLATYVQVTILRRELCAHPPPAACCTLLLPHNHVNTTNGKIPTIKSAADHHTSLRRNMPLRKTWQSVRR